MTTLRERLERKTPRRRVQPVQITPPSPEEDALVAEMLAAITRGDEDASAELRARLEEMRAERYVDIPFAAIDSKLWEKIVARHPSPEGADGGMDWRAALPEVAALSCEDESLQDDDVWRDNVFGPLLDPDDDPKTGQRAGGWSHGEQVGLWGTLLAINTDHPSSHLPKG